MEIMPAIYDPVNYPEGAKTADIYGLVKELKKASDDYYNRGDSELTDEEFDIKVEKLRSLDPENEFLKSVGSHPVGKTFKHDKPVGSQEKLKDRKEFDRWVKQIQDKTPLEDKVISIWLFTIQDKLDGCTMCLYYQNGNLVRALTRGDGLIGEDVTENVLMMQNVKKTLPALFTGCLRGEVLLHKDLFKQHFETLGYKNPRNTVSGMSRDQDHNQLIKYFKVYYFDIDLQVETEQERLEYITNILKLEVVNHTFANTGDELWNNYKSQEFNRENLNYEIDGVVIKANDISVQDDLGMSSDFRPKWSRCVKFEALGAVTVLEDVVLTIGHLGAIYPNGRLKPVQIGGVTVSNVLLNNFEEIERLGIAIGDKVCVIRAGDCIPKLTKLVEAMPGRRLIIQPINCPSCGSVLIKDGAHLFCKNEYCEAKGWRRLKTYLDKRNIKFIGDELLTTLYEQHNIKQPHQLYEFDEQWLSKINRRSGVVGTLARTICSEINKSKECSLQDFIGSLGCPMVGRRQAEILINLGINTVDKFKNLTVEQLISFPGFAADGSKADIVVAGLQKAIPEIDQLLKYIKINQKEEAKVIENVNGKLSNLVFCFTGAIERVDENGKRFTRQMMWEVVKTNGGNVSEDVKAGVTHLVQANKDSVSSKSKKAQKIGVKIISEQEFWELLK